MLVVVAYDVNTESGEGRRRLRRVAKTCEDMGQRVRYSVWEWLVDPAQGATLRHRLCEEINKEEDSLRFYFLGKNWKNNVEHMGRERRYDPEGPLIV